MAAKDLLIQIMTIYLGILINMVPTSEEHINTH